TVDAAVGVHAVEVRLGHVRDVGEARAGLVGGDGAERDRGAGRLDPGLAAALRGVHGGGARGAARGGPGRRGRAGAGGAGAGAAVRDAAAAGRGPGSDQGKGSGENGRAMCSSCSSSVHELPLGTVEVVTERQFTFTTVLTASGGLLIANSNASAARASGKWCEKSLLMFSRAPVTRLMASRKSAPVAVLEPRTSISFSGKIPGRIGAVSERSE